MMQGKLVDEIEHLALQSIACKLSQKQLSDPLTNYRKTTVNKVQIFANVN